MDIRDGQIFLYHLDGHLKCCHAWLGNGLIGEENTSTTPILCSRDGFFSQIVCLLNLH